MTDLRLFRCIAVIGLLFLPGLAAAQTDGSDVPSTMLRSLFDSQNKRIDELASTAQVSRAELLDELNVLKSRIDAMQAFEAQLAGFDGRLKQLEDLADRLDDAIAEAQTLKVTVDRIEEDSGAALDSAEDAQASASATAWILTVVSSIVSVLVILIGLFFSSRFMQLHSENQVSKALLERIERQLAGKPEES